MGRRVRTRRRGGTLVPGAERGSSSAMRLRTTWRTLGEWVRQPAPAQAGPGILSTLLLILCATYQGGMIGSAVLTGRVGDGGIVGGIAPTRIGFTVLILAAIGSTALLTARRRHPLAVFLTECAVYVAASVLGLYPEAVQNVFTTVVSRTGRKGPRWTVDDLLTRLEKEELNAFVAACRQELTL